MNEGTCLASGGLEKHGPVDGIHFYDFFENCLMAESEDKIIVYEAYDTVMQANLAKTKLDAYGIPCFLTEENFTSLYPLRNAIFPGVRLHIFEKDAERVKEVLAGEED